MRTSIIAAALLLAAACGKKNDQAAEPASSPTPSAAAGAPAAQAPATGSAAPPQNTCRLITNDEAAKVLGRDVQPGELRDTGPVPSCHFKVAGAGGSLNLQYFDRGDANYDPVHNTMLKNGVDIAGAGTKASRNVDGSVMLVLANGHLAVMVAMRPGQQNKPAPEVTEELAKTIAGRL